MVALRKRARHGTPLYPELRKAPTLGRWEGQIETSFTCDACTDNYYGMGISAWYDVTN